MERKAGRELGVLVAAHAMGWSRSNDGLGGAWWYDERGNKTIYGGGSSGQSTYKEFRPSTDIAAAWEVVEKFKEFQLWLEGDIFMAELKYADNMEYAVSADTAPLAICLAALKAVGYDESTPPRL